MRNVENLKESTGGGGLTRNIDQKKKLGVLQAYKSLL